MIGIDIRYIGGGVLRTAEGEQLRAEEHPLILPRSKVVPLSLAALRREAKRMWERDIQLLELWVAEVPEQGFDPEKVAFKDISDVRFAAWENFELIVATGHLAEEGEEAWSWVRGLLEPLLRRNKARLLSVGVDPADGLDQVIIATIEPPWRGRTVGDALRLGEEATALVNARRGGELDLATSADLVRTGYAAVLVDQAEGPWLDGKAAPYQLGTDKQKLEFAKDVACFANSPQGGLIVIGAQTASTADGDVIRAVNDVDLSIVSVPRMRAVLRNRIFPTIEGLEILRVDHGGGRGVVMVHVPPQPTDRTPFLVRGVDVEGAVRTTYFGVPEREGEDVRWSDIGTLHGLLQAGKVANALVQSAERNASGSGGRGGSD